MRGCTFFMLSAFLPLSLRWLRDDDVASLVYSRLPGALLLARNEAAGPAVAAGAVVLGVSYARRASAGDGPVPIRSRRIWAR